MTNIITATESLIAWIEGNTKSYVDNQLSLTHSKYFCDRCIAEGKHEIRVGKKYLKIVGHGSVRFFVDSVTGDIFKAASFAAPAKGIRGNVLSTDNGKEASHYGGSGLTFVNYAR
jgi:hypothetical protein